MISWPAPFLPDVPGRGVPLRLHDTATGEIGVVDAGPTALLYVCGITPYDATHLGHAATYVTFDVVNRALRDAGHKVHYVQNITDVDDPLFERAERDGVDWRELGTREIGLFREDMTALGVIPPDDYVGVMESMDLIIDSVVTLLDAGRAYGVPVDGGGEDIYFDLSSAPEFGHISHLDRATMIELSAQRGGDPDRAGKRDPLDPLLWRAERPGEPSWSHPRLGAGRPGWHIECTSITIDRLGVPIDIKGGGSDLVFPHHEMSSVQAHGVTGQPVFARRYVHQAMVGFEGEKMSKSKGNLVLVSALRRSGVEPMAIRLVLLARHYRTDWEYTDADLAAATQRLERWRAAFSGAVAAPSEDVVAAVRGRVADDLDTPGALVAVDAWAERTLAGDGTGGDTAAGVLARTLDALLGVRL